MMFHPRLNDHGKPEGISKPHSPSAISAWSNPSQAGIVVPDGPMPGTLNGMDFKPWPSPPRTPEGWLALARGRQFKEPSYDPMSLQPAAGAVILEPDGRIWLVAPTNGYGGYEVTFPKGKTDGADLRATAIKESYEESGLRVELLAHLVDVPRSTSVTRYYLARRTGGSPSDMSWESQAVLLVPVDQLKTFLNNKYDMPILDALLKTTHSRISHGFSE